MATHRNARRETQTTNAVDVTATAGPPAVTSDVQRADDRERIAARAYGYYVERGRQDGHDLDDWLAAEREVGEQPLRDS